MLGTPSSIPFSFNLVILVSTLLSSSGSRNAFMILNASSLHAYEVAIPNMIGSRSSAVVGKVSSTPFIPPFRAFSLYLSVGIAPRIPVKYPVRIGLYSGTLLS